MTANQRKSKSIIAFHIVFGVVLILSTLSCIYHFNQDLLSVEMLKEYFSKENISEKTHQTAVWALGFVIILCILIGVMGLSSEEI